MTLTVGYVKDAIAFLVFSCALLLAIFKQIPYALIIYGLVACAVVDGLFSANPDWHCRPWGKNVATYVVMFQAALALAGIFVYYVVVS